MPICGNSCIGLVFNKYLCVDCGYVEHYGTEALKALLGNAYAEIDEMELNCVVNSRK